MKAGTPGAFCNLGWLCDNGKIPGGPTKAAEYYKKSKSTRALLNLLFLHEKNPSSCNLNEQQIHATKQTITAQIQSDENEAEKQCYLGSLFRLEKNYEQALFHYTQAVELGYNEASAHLSSTQEIVYQQNKLEKLQAVDDAASAQAGSAEVPEEDESDEDDDSDSQEESKAIEGDQPTVQEPMASAASSSPAVQISQRIKQPLTKHKRIAKTEKKLERNIQKAQKHSFAFQLSGEDKKEAKVLPPPIIEYVNDNVRTAYEALSTNPKLTELMTDLWEKPWATEGAGKPEILKGKFKGHKGCISRRLDQENRFVYKVTGSRQILIVSCEGHYND